MESAIRASISRIKDLTYVFTQLCHWIKHLDNLDNERSGRDEESFLVTPNGWEESKIRERPQ